MNIRIILILIILLPLPLGVRNCGRVAIHDEGLFKILFEMSNDESSGSRRGFDSPRLNNSHA